MWHMNDYAISTDRSLLDVEMIHRFISTEAYWGLGRSREFVERAMEHSTYCFGVYHVSHGEHKQIGFARVISDLTTFGYLADVFIIEGYRGKGIGTWLIQTILNHPELQTLKRFALFTRSPEFYTPAMFALYDQVGESKFMVRTNR